MKQTLCGCDLTLSWSAIHNSIYTGHSMDTNGLKYEFSDLTITAPLNTDQNKLSQQIFVSENKTV